LTQLSVTTSACKGCDKSQPTKAVTGHRTPKRVALTAIFAHVSVAFGLFLLEKLLVWQKFFVHSWFNLPVRLTPLL
jgi:hypothetical protein